LRADSVALLEGWGARGGPEHLINMATCQRRRHLRHEAAAAPPMATPVPQTTPWTIATEQAGSERAFTEGKGCPSARRQNPSPPMHAANWPRLRGPSEPRVHAAGWLGPRAWRMVTASSLPTWRAPRGLLRRWGSSNAQRGSFFASISLPCRPHRDPDHHMTPQPLIKRSQRRRRSGRSWACAGRNGAL
jgi:hypothetical protein